MAAEMFLLREISENLPQLISLLPAVPLLGATLIRIKGLTLEKTPHKAKSKVEPGGETVVMFPTGEHGELSLLSRGEEKFSLRIEDFKIDHCRNTGHGNVVIQVLKPNGDIAKRYNLNKIGEPKEISHGVFATYYPKTYDVPEKFPPPIAIVFPVCRQPEPALVE